MDTIDKLKEQSNRKHFASVLGKSTIDLQSNEYKIIGQITEVLFKNDFGVIHGGYAGGAMQAVSDTAQRIIIDQNLPVSCNIAIPQVQHDGLWDRVSQACFANVSPDIFERLRAVASGDVAIVCPLGGDGTDLEQTLVFHENVVKIGMNKYGGCNYKMTPLIFFQTPNGTNWKKIIQTKMKLLDVSVRDIKQYEWLHFLDSTEELDHLIRKLKQDL